MAAEHAPLTYLTEDSLKVATEMYGDPADGLASEMMVHDLLIELDAQRSRVAVLAAEGETLKEEREAARQRVHDWFRRRTEAGQCACPYCTGNAEEIYEHAANLELELHSQIEKAATERARADAAESRGRLAVRRELTEMIQRFNDDEKAGMGDLISWLDPFLLSDEELRAARPAEPEEG